MKDKFSKLLEGDKIIWGIVFLLFLMSMLTVYSSTVSLAYRRGSDSLVFLGKHFAQLAAGFIIMVIIHKMNYKIFKKFTIFILFVGIGLLLFTLLFGVSKNDASRWIRIPIVGLTFQPSEFAKIALLMFVAKYLERRSEYIKDFNQGFLYILIPVIIVCGLIFRENFSTAALLFITCSIVMFIGNVRVKHLIISGGAILVAGVALIAIMYILNPNYGRVATWVNRMESFSSKSDKEEDFQVVQAKIAVASSGLVGKGPGNSTQKYFLPHAYSDYIYAIICEEYGIWGPFLILALYLTLLFRVGVIVNKSNVQYPAYLAVGIVLMLVFQALVNMLVSVNLMPVTGQTLPLVSWGGSSILINSFAMGMVLSVSRTIQKQQEDEDSGNRIVIDVEDDFQKKKITKISAD